MLFVAEDKAEDEGLLGDDDAWFTIAMPDSTVFRILLCFLPELLSSVLPGWGQLRQRQCRLHWRGAVGDHLWCFGDGAFIADELYLFEVDTFSLAPAGYGALLITYSGVVDDFVIDFADWVEEFTLVAPPAALTVLFDFDFAPADFGKVGPMNGALDQPASLTLSWGASLGATSYEYCIDESADTVCDTGWISTGTDTSVTLSGLPYNATYFWQVRAVNSYETT